MKNLEKKWNKYFHYSKLPMLFIDNNFNILAVNESFKKKLGYDMTELLKMNFIELFAEDATDRLEQLIFRDKYYSFLIKLHLSSKEEEIIRMTTCMNNFFSISGDYEESLVVLNPIETENYLSFGLLGDIFGPTNYN